MKKIVYVLGDVEIGGGTLTDDFIADKVLARFINQICKVKEPVDLIFNGDTFDFLKCPFIVRGKVSYPRHITTLVSLNKLHSMHLAHQRIFITLRRFVSKKKNNLYFIFGNHDHDLHFSHVQSKIKDILKSKNNIFFKETYKFNNIRVEHGHQYDFLNKVNQKRPFMNYKKEKILNIPWVSLSLISRFMDLKESHPFSERILPRPTLFSHHKSVIKQINFKAIKYLLLTFLYYPLRYFSDPTYTIPREIFREFYRRFKNVHWDVDDIIEVFKKKKKRRKKLHPRIQVLGHVHKKYIEEKDGWVIIHTDSWRDEYFFDHEKQLLIPKTKKYLKIDIDNDQVKWNLLEVDNKHRKNIKFSKLLKNEFECIKQAASEEGYLLTQYQV